MRTRYKGPSSTGILELKDDASVRELFSELEAATGINNFTIKYGPPMAMEQLDSSHYDLSAKAIGLHGQSLTIVPQASAPTEEPESSKVEQSSQNPWIGQNSTTPQTEESTDGTCVPWPEREGTLLLRVMPSDNSCLFTAFGGALPSQIPAPQLRNMMADYIVQHSDLYNEAVLGSPPHKYCQSIRDPDRWGGGIELSILSAIFDIQICTFDVQAERLMEFGENKRDRCILVYSGIHYDRVAFAFTEFPHRSVTLPPEMDCTMWSTDDDSILEKAQQLVHQLNKAHYYTDTEGLLLKCDVPGCDWIGSGQAEGSKHAQMTGHVALSEIKDTEDENTLRRCDAPGCDFIGQGNQAMQHHSADVGHDRYTIIQDM